MPVVFNTILALSGVRIPDMLLNFDNIFSIKIARGQYMDPLLDLNINETFLSSEGRFAHGCDTLYIMKDVFLFS